MEKHTVALLTECEAGLKMEISSMEQTLPRISDVGFKLMFQDYYLKHCKLQEECERLLKELENQENQYEKNPSKVAQLMSGLKNAKCDDIAEVADF